LSLKLGYAALRAQAKPKAKGYFLDANRSASFVSSDAESDQRATALDIMKKSKAEADQLEKDGY